MAGAGGDAVRAFVALELGAALREQLAAEIARLRPRLTSARFVRPEGIHLTLRFLGQMTPAARATLEEPLAEAAGQCPRTEAHVRGLGTFPARGRVRVLWLGIEVPSAVVALQQACERAARAAGFAAEDRPFRPHLTLARFDPPAPRPELPALDLGTTALPELVLFQSTLSRGGAVYTRLRTFPLGGAR